MTTNIYLARLLAEERERDFRGYAESRRRVRRRPRKRDSGWLWSHLPWPVRHATGAAA